jgi:hypothetical protein
MAKMILRFLLGIVVALGLVGGTALAEDEEDAVAVIRHYYGAINAKQYKAAFGDWEGASSGTNVKGQTLATFKKGFKGTASVTVSIGVPGQIEGAAGSSYIEIPVNVTSRPKTGQARKFSGSYTLRKSNLSEADGATVEMRTWRIYSASLAPIN